jgi:ubiquinol-cytochrome c reductase cytochrome c subunit
MSAKGGGDGRRRFLTAAGLAACVAVGALVFVASYAAGQTPGTNDGADDPELVAAGRALYQTGCSSCHGEDAKGSDEVPSLIGVGAAAADFQLRTGRMPLPVIGEQAVRKPPAYSDAEIKALVAYVASLGPGPAIPTVDVATADIVNGGDLFRANCAACHNAAGVGGALSYGHHAPSLLSATPTEVVEAMRTGPGQMPVFGEDTFTDAQATDIAAYVTGALQHPDNRGGFPLGSTGPVPEGFVAWTVGIVVIGAALRWIVRGLRTRRA